MSVGDFPWWITPSQGVCACWQCGGHRPWQSASTGFTSMTYRQTHMAETWAEAVSFAIRLRATGSTLENPAVRRLGNRWEVRWKPHLVSFNFTD